MEKQLLSLFQHEVIKQCEFALTAVDDLNQALRSRNSNRAWYSIQTFLIAVGNISKLLWPPPPKPKMKTLLSISLLGKSFQLQKFDRIQSASEQRVDLRKSLSVDDNSPLAPRKFRNHFEHFDERLESWAKKSKRRNFVDSNIGPPGFIKGFEKGDYIRNLDTTNKAVTFRGDEYKLQPVADAVKELMQKAMVEVAKERHASKC